MPVYQAIASHCLLTESLDVNRESPLRDGDTTRQGLYFIVCKKCGYSLCRACYNFCYSVALQRSVFRGTQQIDKAVESSAEAVGTLSSFRPQLMNCPLCGRRYSTNNTFVNGDGECGGIDLCADFSRRCSSIKQRAPLSFFDRVPLDDMLPSDDEIAVFVRGKGIRHPMSRKYDLFEEKKKRFIFPTRVIRATTVDLILVRKKEHSKNSRILLNISHNYRNVTSEEGLQKNDQYKPCWVRRIGPGNIEYAHCKIKIPASCMLEGLLVTLHQGRLTSASQRHDEVLLLKAISPTKMSKRNRCDPFAECSVHLEAHQNLLFCLNHDRNDQVERFIHKIKKTSGRDVSVSELQFDRNDTPTCDNYSSLESFLTCGSAPLSHQELFTCPSPKRQRHSQSLVTQCPPKTHPPKSGCHIIIVHNIDMFFSRIVTSGKLHEKRGCPETEAEEIQWIWTITCPLQDFLSFLFYKLGHVESFRPENFGLWSPFNLRCEKGCGPRFSIFDVALYPMVQNINSFGLQITPCDQFRSIPLLSNAKIGHKKGDHIVLDPPKSDEYHYGMSTDIVRALPDVSRRFLRTLLSIYFEKRDLSTQTISMQNIREEVLKHGYIYPDRDWQFLRMELETHRLLETKKDRLKFTCAGTLWKALQEPDEKHIGA